MRVYIEVTRDDGWIYRFMEHGRLGEIVRILLTHPWSFTFQPFDGSKPHDAYVHLDLSRNILFACLPRSDWTYVQPYQWAG